MRLPRRPEPFAVALAVAASLAGPAVPARADDDAAPGSGGALRIAADPPRLVLGRDGGAELRIAAPPEVEDVVLSASAGRIEGVRRLPGGGFAARYHPPAERHPQVAILAALARTSRGLADGWLAVPLSGQGDARVRAQPGTEITLRIGDRLFGPRRVGPDGAAVIPVVVPPGVREAHHGFRPIDLHVPETPLLHTVADRGVIHADRVEQVHVLAYVVAPHGAARRGDVPLFEPSRGAVAFAPREPGAFEALWTVPPGASSEDRLVVRLPGSPASRAVVRLEVVPGPPATIAVAFDRATLEAGAAEEVAVTARVLDAYGNAAPAEVELAADGGTLGGSAPTGPGAVAARLRIPPAFGARRAVTVTAQVRSAGITGARALPLRPGPPAEARFTPKEDVLFADGTREASLRVAVLDRFENPVETVPAVVARRGKIVAVDADGGGAWVVRYRAPRVPARTEEQVVAQFGPVQAQADLLLVPPRRGLAVLPAVGAALDLRGRFAAARFGAAAELAAEPPVGLAEGIGFAWRLEAEALGFGRTGPEVTVAIPGPGPEPRLEARRLHTDVRAFGLLGGATVRRELRHGPELRLSVAAGALLAHAAPDGARSGTGLAPAARFTLGAELPLKQLTPFLELSALAAGRTPAGAFAALGLAAGVRFDLGVLPWPRS